MPLSRLPWAIIALAMAALVGAPLVSGAPPVQSSLQAPSRALIAEVPFRLVANKICVDATVNGAGPFPFVFDSGSPPVVLDEDLANQLEIERGPEFQVGGAGASTMRGAMARGVRIGRDGLNLGQQQTIVMPLTRFLGPTSGMPIAGLLGNYLGRRYTLEIDYDKSVLRFYDPDEYEYDGPGHMLDARFSSGHVIVDATVTPRGGEPRTLPFILDTGSRLGLTLNTPTVNQHNLLDATPTILAAVGHGVGGRITHPVGRVERFSIAGFDIDNPVTTFSQDQGGILASEHVAGIVGADLLKRFTLILDYQRRRVILEPNDALDDPSEFDMSGLWLEARGQDFNQMIVAHITEGSPAAEAGLEVEDRLVEVDGRPAAAFTRSELVDLFRSEDGRQIPLVIDRMGKRIPLTLRLRRQV